MQFNTLVLIYSHYYLPSLSFFSIISSSCLFQSFKLLWIRRIVADLASAMFRFITHLNLSIFYSITWVGIRRFWWRRIVLPGISPQYNRPPLIIRFNCTLENSFNRNYIEDTYLCDLPQNFSTSCFLSIRWVVDLLVIDCPVAGSERSPSESPTGSGDNEREIIHVPVVIYKFSSYHEVQGEDVV